MANEFIIKNGFFSQGNSNITGSLNILGGAAIIQSNNDGYLQIGNNNGGFVVENYNRTDVKLKANAIMTSRGTGITFRTTVGEPINYVPLGVIGSGTTSATTALLVQNANASASLSVLDNGFIGIGTSSPSNSLTVRTGVTDDGILLESSTGNPLFLVRKDGFSSSTAELFQYSGGVIRLAIRSTSNFSYFNGGNFGFGTPTDVGYRLTISGSSTSGSLNVDNILYVSGSNVGIGISGSLSKLAVYKSGSTVLDIQGSQGQLFSVVDALSGSLMSVNDVSGLPILEVFSDDRVVMGTYGAPALTISGSAVTVATASAAPSGTVPEGTFRFATVGGAYFIYVYIGGAWRSGSLS